MDRQHLVGACVFAFALVAAGAAEAAPQPLRVALRTSVVAIDDDLSSGGGDWIPLDSYGDRGVELAKPAGDDDQLVAPAVMVTPTEVVKGARKKKMKHKACVHGGWTSTVEYNPFTLSCATIGF